MAFMNREKKQALAPGIKAVLDKHKVKGTMAVRNHSTLVINIKSGVLDIIGNARDVAQQRGDFDAARWADAKYVQVNRYWIDQHYSGAVLEFLRELIAAANKGNHDRSDIMSDYFDVGWYLDINVGSWDKPYEVIA
jgi:hypothetical protein